jgi:ankyrin repeat protein
MMAHAGSAPQNATRPREPERSPRLDLAMVNEFVIAGHGNLDKVKQMLVEQPKLVNAAWDWGGGDWETALGGASHTGHSDIAKFLLSQGARIDSFCAAMLGEREVVRALVAANPSVATAGGPHGLTLLYHVAISGNVAIAEALKPHLPPQAADYNQALSAAARDGRLAMTSWLLKNGVTDPNVPDAFHKTPLAIALARGFADVAEELRRHGGREAI